MATSYKTLYQQEAQNVERLGRTVEQLGGDLEAMKAEILRLNALLAEPDQGSITLAKMHNEIVDLAAIARHMRVARHTPQQWSQRKLLPPVDFPDLAEPLWYASTIREKFAIPTKRIWYTLIDQTDEELSPAA